MTTILFATINGGGNLPPTLGIAAELQRRGVEVAMLGHAQQRVAVESAGLPFEAYTRAIDFDPSARRSTLEGVRAATAVFADRGITADAMAAAQRLGAQAVVVDCLTTGPLSALIDAGVPTVSLMHTFWDYFRRTARGPIGAAMRLRGVDMAKALEAPRLTIVTARRDFDPARSVPPDMRHVGVVHQGRPVAASPAPDLPRILVSLSTQSFPGQDRALQAVLDAVGGLRAEVVVTTGPAVDPAALRAPANATVHRWLDHEKVLPTTSLVIGHGGHATTMRALSYGVPLLILPMHPLLDQRDIARAVGSRGAALSAPKSSRPERLRAAIDLLLGEPRFRRAAEAIGTEIRSHDGAVTAADLLEEFAAEGRVDRPSPPAHRA